MRKFRDLKIGEKFEVYGDECLNYEYPKICVCVKEDESTGKEIDGIRFGIHPGTEIFEHEEK
jgi:hypothetical protein